MSHLPAPKAIIFDWDNTLVDTWPTIHQALNMTLDHMQHPRWTLERVKAEVKQSMRDSFPAMFGDRWEEAALHYQQSYRSKHLDSLNPLTEAEALLKYLKSLGLFLAVVSNKKGDTLRLEIEHLGWGHYFTSIVGAQDAKRDKPHADPVLMAMEKYASAFGSEVWFIGDTAVDLECAGITGCTPILYGDHTPEGMVHDGHGFAAHVRSHEELILLIQNALTDAA